MRVARCLLQESKLVTEDGEQKVKCWVVTVNFASVVFVCVCVRGIVWCLWVCVVGWCLCGVCVCDVSVVFVCVWASVWCLWVCVGGWCVCVGCGVFGCVCVFCGVCVCV